ncbi:MAG: ankyrin repeat domain-containing protein [Gemmatimonadales bacterium]
MIRPEPLKRREPWLWSPGRGTDVWELFCACIAGDLPAVERLVEADSSLVRSHYEYRTPLSFAVRENQVAVAAFLLDHGADPLVFGNLLELARHRGYAEMARLIETTCSRLGASTKGEVVAVAIRERTLQKVRDLLDQTPELIHEGDGRSCQPIHWAVMTRQLDMIDELLSRGADINARREDGARPIHLTNGDYTYRGWRDVPQDTAASPDDVYKHLVGRRVYVDIGMAAAKGDIERVRELIDQDPSLVNRVSDYNSYYIGCGAPIKNAAARGHRDVVELLLERGADPNLPEEGIAPHGHALYSAIYNGHLEIARLLLEHGAYPNPEVESSADAVSIAIANGDTKSLELLASYGVTWNIHMQPGGGLRYEDIVATGIGRSVTILAIHGDVETAAPLFAANAMLADDPEALENAASHGQEEFVRLMLRYQPDLPKRVTVSRPFDMAELLFEYGMDPNRPNWQLITPLHRFAGDGDVESAALFIDHGADLNVRDEELRTTPLGYAANSGRKSTVDLLLARGAKPDLPDDPPWATPLAYATRRGHDDIVQMLTARNQRAND